MVTYKVTLDKGALDQATFNEETPNELTLNKGTLSEVTLDKGHWTRSPIKITFEVMENSKMASNIWQLTSDPSRD